MAKNKSKMDSKVVSYKMKPLLSIRELAAVLGMSERWVRDLIRKQKIPVVKFAKDYKFMVSDVETFLKLHRKLKGK